MGVDHLWDKFHVISVCSNPVRYSSRYELYKQFEAEMRQLEVSHFKVEVAFGDRAFAVTEHTDPKALQLRTDQEIWHKENMINLAIQRLPDDWQYVAWIDADVMFARKDIIEETIHQLQHYQVVQMFRNALDLGPKGEVMQSHTGFAFSYVNQLTPPKPYYTNWHPGFAWAARREAIDALGGLIDKSILGAGDRHMALSLVGKGADTVEKRMHPTYHQMVAAWEQRAERYIRRDIGFVDGTLMHYFHGRKVDRRYFDRWKILVNYQFNPYEDLKRDWQGLYQLNDHGTVRDIKFRDDLRAYFRGRNEDATEA